VRNEDFINSLIEKSPPDPVSVNMDLVKGEYYPRQADWAVRWIGFFDTFSPAGNKVLRNLPLIKVHCCHCIWHSVTDAREKVEKLAESHWFDKHTRTGRELAAKRTKPLVINYDGEPPF